MDHSSREVVAGWDRFLARARHQDRRVVFVLIASAFIILAPGTFRPTAIKAQEPPAGEPVGGSFSRFGKIYINLSLVTHVIDDPGENLPLGAMQVHFSGSPGKNFVNIFGADAEALRKTLDEPAAEPEEPVAKKATSGARRKKADDAKRPPMIEIK